MLSSDSHYCCYLWCSSFTANFLFCNKFVVFPSLLEHFRKILLVRGKIQTMALLQLILVVLLCARGCKGCILFSTLDMKMHAWCAYHAIALHNIVGHHRHVICVLKHMIIFAQVLCYIGSFLPCYVTISIFNLLGAMHLVLHHNCVSQKVVSSSWDNVLRDHGIHFSVIVVKKDCSTFHLCKA